MTQERQFPEHFRFRYGAGVTAQLVGAVAALGFSFFFWREGISGVAAVIWLSFAFLVVLFCLTFGDTQFQAAPPRVFRQWKFLGLIPVWRRDYSLDTFTGIQRRHRRGPDDGIWTVGFVGASGGFLAVQWFYSGSSDGPCPEANVYALQLAEITGLPLVETRVA
jgi:hypothetical protein